MNNTLNTPSHLQSKDNHFQGQMKIVFAALCRQPKTMLMVSVETGISRANICRFVAAWRKQDSIKIVRFGICSISKRSGVQFLTTNPELVFIVEPSKAKNNE